MKKTISYFKRLKPTELGQTQTHDTYLRLPNEFDCEDFLQSPMDDHNGVLEKVFKAKNLTKGHETDEMLSMRIAYFINSNQEKRIPGIREIFEANNVRPDDIVHLESRIKDGDANFYITFLKPDEAKISTSQFYSTIIECEEDGNKEDNEDNVSRQQIYYGAPGTGKSHKVKRLTDDGKQKGRVVRTTFHPDSDYSTFVGAYKPTMEGFGGGKRITYEFVGQAFLQAYVEAWTHRKDSVYLVIEEINRGNCAQIFGDLFQLLDRGDDGFSEYPIRADRDLQAYLAQAFKGDGIAEDYPEVKSGEKLILPCNLYILGNDEHKRPVSVPD
ncbi:MAG: AAA family ATPase [Prevotella sp.]|nr:AAA family ATPase [Prevotella sp.]